MVRVILILTAFVLLAGAAGANVIVFEPGVPPDWMLPTQHESCPMETCWDICYICCGEHGPPERMCIFNCFRDCVWSESECPTPWPDCAP